MKHLPQKIVFQSFEKDFRIKLEYFHNRLFRRNNRLFIPVKIITTEFKEFKEERDAQTVYTGSLLNQELHSVSQKPLVNPLSNQNQITYTHH